MSGGIGFLEHLWGRSPFSVRRGAEVAQRADRGDTHTHNDFTQLRAAWMRKTLLLLVWLIRVLALERKNLQYVGAGRRRGSTVSFFGSGSLSSSRVFPFL